MIFGEPIVMTIIRQAVFPADAPAVLDIWREFVASPSVSLAHQNNHVEFADIPGKYAEPDGRILLADWDGEVDGCVALKRVDRYICEMKRLYVRPAARGHALGRRLVEQLVADARELGYASMRLDTVPAMATAQRLYEHLGFQDTPPYTANPVPGARFMQLRLGDPGEPMFQNNDSQRN